MQKRTWIKIAAALLLAVPVVYIGVQVAAIMNRPYTTQTAIRYQMADKTEVNGVFCVQQTPLTYSGSVLSCLVSDGERVSAGTNVAAVFSTTQAAQNSDYARQLALELEYLGKAQDASAAATDIQLLQKQINAVLTTVAAMTDGGQLVDVSEQKMLLQYYTSKLQLGTAQNIDLSGIVNNVTQAYQSAEAAGAPQAFITATERGYFVSAANTVQQQYTAEELSAMSAPALAEASARPLPESPAGTAGYIITDNTWRYYCTIPLADASKYGGSANTAYLSFTGSDENAIPVVVESVEEDTENGLAKLVLSSDYFNTDVIGRQTHHATVYAGNGNSLYYEGLRVDKAALRIVDGQYGVYIRYGNVVQFAPILIIFEDENYLLVSDEYDTEYNKLKMYDEVIVSGTDLYDGKIL